MTPEILDYITSQRIGVLAVEMLDGSPHGATLHFAYSENPLTFWFKTHHDYRKAKPILKNEVTRAAFVVGCDEANMKTLQMDGEVRSLKPEQVAEFEKIYLGKFPEKKAGHDVGNFLGFTFTPTWWRFTDWTGPEGKKIITSSESANSHE